MMKLEKMTYDVMTDFIRQYTGFIIDGVNVLEVGKMRYLLAQHIDKKFFMPKNENATPSQYLYSQWLYFILTYRDNYEKRYQALLIDYEPLNNYDKNSTITTTKTDVFGEHSDNSTVEIGGHTVNSNNSYGEMVDSVETTNGEYTNTSTNALGERHSESTSINKVNGYNSEDYSNNGSTSGTADSNSVTDELTEVFGEKTDSTTNTHGSHTDTLDTTISSQTNTDNTTHSSQTNTGNETIIERTYGNIGVTTSQQMLESELELRLLNLNKWFVDLFAKENLFYC